VKVDGKGREGTYNFFLTTTGAGQPEGAGHSTQGAAAPCHPAGAAQGGTCSCSAEHIRTFLNQALQCGVV